MTHTPEYKAIVEQIINELSSDTLKSYSNKAAAEVRSNTELLKGRAGPKPKAFKAMVAKRTAGIGKANKKVLSREMAKHAVDSAIHKENFHKEVHQALHDHGYTLMGAHPGKDTYVKSHGTHVTIMTHDKNPSYPSIRGGDGESSWSSHTMRSVRYRGGATPVGGHGVSEYMKEIHDRVAQRAKEDAHQHAYRMKQETE